MAQPRLTPLQLADAVAFRAAYPTAQEAADALGIPVQTLNGRLRRAKAAKLISNDAPKVEPRSIPDRRATALADENRALKEALKAAQRELIEAEGIKTLFETVGDKPRSMPSWLVNPPEPKRKSAATPEVPVAMWADWHLGETVNREEVNGVNEYSLTIAERRVQRLVEGTVNLCRNHHTGNYPGAVVCLTGDFVSGGLHPELLKTDEEEILPSTLRALDLITGGLKRLADVFGQLYVPAVAGNHGRNTAKPEFKRYIFKNFDWLIYKLLAREFADDPRVHIDVRPSNDVHFRVYHDRYLLMHGDMLGVRGGDGIIGAIGPIMRGEVKKSGQSSAIGLEFDKLLIGHWHQGLWLPRATVANTLKGFDEYARLQLGAKPTRPSQPLWFVHPKRGETAQWPIYVDEPMKAATTWVSWRNA
jgi:hypothetical protein